MEQDSIQLGELSVKITSVTYEHLVRLLKEMDKLTPALRHQRLIQYVTLTKSRFSRFHGICEWIKHPIVKVELKKILSNEAQLDRQKDQFNRTQDELFFLHQSLYGRRKRSFNVLIADDILRSNSYRYLPRSIFQANSIEYPMKSVDKKKS